MRKRTLFAVLTAIGAMILIVFANSNWLLAAAVGVGLGLIVFVFVHAYPHDIAPPSDRRHENTLRRRAAQRDSLR
jgi:MFS family permease